MIKCERGFIQLKGDTSELIADMTVVMKAFKDHGMNFITEIAYDTYDLTPEEFDEKMDNAKAMLDEFCGMAVAVSEIINMSDEEREALRKKLKEESE